MKYPILPILLILGMGLATPSLARADCNESVVVDGTLTTVVVTAGSDELCAWQEIPNSENSNVVSISGVVVPKPLASPSVEFKALSILVADNSTFGSTAICSTNGLLSLVCSDLGQDQDVGPAIPTQFTERICQVKTDHATSSAIATCIFLAVN